MNTEKETGKRQMLNEVAFCQRFLEVHPMAYTGGRFYTLDGMVPDESTIRREIYEELKLLVSSGLSKRVDSILGTLKMECARENLREDTTRIHVANGTYHLLDGFDSHRMYCRHRLPVAYNADAPEPRLWLGFLAELLEPEDICTLQEFMGYCLIPTNMGQKMLLIIGRGGEGKSRVGMVMRDLLGDHMYTGSINKVESSPFARADLEHKLLMLDDDLRLEALSNTNYLKSIITAELPMDLERKGIQSYQGRLYARFMAFGNGNLQALHDRSYGFFRRQIILSAKPRPRDRVDDPYLAVRLREEREGIFLWALDGLNRLLANDFRFTQSRQAQRNLRDAIIQGNNAVEFMSSKGYLVTDPEGLVSSRALYQVYREWCDDNALQPISAVSFWTFLSQNAHAYGIRVSRSVPIGNGRYARGFRGIRLAARY